MRLRGLVIGAVIVLSGPFLAVLLGALASKVYWGHFFSRPSPSRLLRGAATVRSLAEVDFRARVDGTVTVTGASAVDDAEQRVIAGIAHPEYPHYYLHERVLEVLLPKLPSGSLPKDDGLVADVAAQLGRRGLLVRPGPGYELLGNKADGIVAAFENASGKAFVVAALSQGSVSNDHHPYHEIVFVLEPDGSLGPVASHNRFYFDVAGLEGMTWWNAASCAFIPATLLAAAVAGAVGGRAFVMAQRMSQGVCTKCRYDLAGLSAGVCPECGTRFPPRRLRARRQPYRPVRVYPGRLAAASGQNASRCGRPIR